MAHRVNPNLIDDLKLFGVRDALKCSQCGNCSATCPHSENPDVLPRRPIHYLQMGLEKPLRSSLDPWLCYYCGDCSDQCPRGAEPGEAMMGLRRWLTSQYDITGFSGLLYRSWGAQLTAVRVLALLTGIGFLGFGFYYGGGDLAIYDGPEAFLPAHAVHIFDWALASFIVFFLSINCFRMWYFSMGSQKSTPVPLSIYLRNLWLLPVHFFSQKQFRKCNNKRPWALHLILMLSYITMLILIMLFLDAVQSGPRVNWYVHSFGYLAAIGLVTTAVLAIIGRLKRDTAYHRLSHNSDWLFLGLLLYVATTGIVQHIFHRTGFPMAANLAYIAHMMGVVPMLTTGEPFNKWAHLAYRPFAMYLVQVRKEALAVNDRAFWLQPGVAPAETAKPLE